MARQTETRLGEKLDRITRLLAIIAVRDLPQMNQIAILSRAGLSPKEIAESLGTTSNTVRVALVTIRRDERKKKWLKLRNEED